MDFVIENGELKEYKGSGGRVVIPNGVKKIGWHAFEDCESVTSVVIPEGVTAIGWSAFEGCSNLSSIIIPDSVTDIDSYAFAKTAFYTNPANWENGVLYIGNVLIEAQKSLKGIYRIKHGVKTIQQDTFKDCAELTEIVIPDTVIRIDRSAFENCTGLTKIIIPNSVKEISSNVFRGCTSLTSITLPDSLDNLYLGVFQNCKELKSITLPDGLTSIYSDLFRGCTALTSIVLPDSVNFLGNDVFNGCTNLATVNLPEGVTHIGKGAFTGTACYNDPNNRKNGVFCIGDYVIECPVSLSGGCVIRKGVKVIASSAFEGCTKLTDVTIPDGITHIDTNAFKGCTGLKSISIPDSVTNISREAFDGCSALESIKLSEGITFVGNNAFRGTLYYSNKANWQNGILYLGNCLIKVDPELKGICKIKDGTKMIASYAFEACEKLTDISIPDSVTEINYCAFSGCRSITSISIPEGVSRLSSSIFEKCENLKEIYLPDSITGISNYDLNDTAFYKNPSNWENGVLYLGNHLVEATDKVRGSYAVKNGTKTISSRAFEKCPDLTDIFIPDSVECIGWNTITETAYFNNPNNWEDGVLYVGKHLIKAKADLSGSYVVKSGTKTIAYNAFGGCNNLTYIFFPEEVRSLGYYNLNTLDDVTAETIDEIAENIGITPSGNKNIVSSIADHVSIICGITLPEKTYDTPVEEIDKVEDTTAENKKLISTLCAEGKIGKVLNLLKTTTVTARDIDGFVKAAKENTELIAHLLEHKVKIDNSPEVADAAGKQWKKVYEFAREDNGYAILEYRGNSESVIVPATIKGRPVVEIGSSAFKNHKSMTSVVIPKGTTKIGSFAFSGCKMLSRVIFPTSVDKIGLGAFMGCRRVVIHGYMHTEAYKYATKKNIEFVNVND